MSFVASSGFFEVLVIVHASVPSIEADPAGHMNGQFIIIAALPAVITFVASFMPT